MSVARILVVGFGNVLTGDDGAGPAVVRRLRELGLPVEVRAVEAGSDSLILPTLWAGEAAIWMVDAVVGGAQPGAVHRLEHDRILKIPQRHATVHHLSLPESLRWIALTYPEMATVRYRLWGIEPASLELGAGLSEPIGRAVDEVAREIREDAAHLHHQDSKTPRTRSGRRADAPEDR